MRAVTVALVSATGDEPASVGTGASQLRSRLRTLRDDVSRVQSADEVLGLLDRDRLRSADGLADVVGRGSETAVRSGLDRIIEMPSPLRELLPGQGLRRGSTVTVRGSTSLLLEMLGAATRSGLAAGRCRAARRYRRRRRGRPGGDACGTGAASLRACQAARRGACLQGRVAGDGAD